MRKFKEGQRVKIKTSEIPFYEKTKYHFHDYIGIVKTPKTPTILPVGVSVEDIAYLTNGLDTYWFFKDTIESVEELPKELFEWEEEIK